MRKWFDRSFVWYSWLASMGLLAMVAVLIAFLLHRGAGTLSPQLLFGDTAWWPAVTGRQPVFDGLWPAIVGTLLLVAGASALAIPIGIGGGIYLAEFARGRLGRIFSLLVDILSGVPSIIMGLFGFTAILFLRRNLFPEATDGLLLAMVCIALLVLPYLIRTTESALRGIATPVRLTGPGLGLSHWQTIRHVLLPASSRGILSGAILAVGRAAEDTAVIMLTGVVANSGIPGGLTDKFEALPFNIFYLTAEHRTPEQLDLAFGASIILLGLTGGLFVLSYWLQRSLEKRWALTR